MVTKEKTKCVPKQLKQSLLDTPRQGTSSSPRSETTNTLLGSFNQPSLKRHLKSLIYKNLLAKKRAPWGTITEFFLPAVFLGFMCIASELSSDDFWDSYGETTAVNTVLFLTLCPINLVKMLVEEKEMKFKPIMLQMGLFGEAYVLSFIVWYTLFFGLMALFLTGVTWYSLFGHGDSDFLLVFGWFFLLLMNVIPMGFFVSAFFNNARNASFAAGLSFFLMGAPYYGFSDGSGPVFVLACCLLPPTAFIECTRWYADKVDAGDGLTWENWGSTGTLKVPIMAIYAMMTVDIFVWSFMAWYVGEIMPSETGACRPWNFIFKKEFWFPRSAEGVDVQEVVLTALDEEGGDGEGGHSVTEAVPQNLRRQVRDGSCIAIRNLTKNFGGEMVAVKKLNLTMFRGQVTCLLGHNGAGKSTTINMLTGMLTITSGQIVVNNNSANSPQGMSAIRRDLGVCPQHNVLYNHMTVREHLEMFAAFKGVPEELVADEVESVIHAVGLAEKREERVESLSGGQKRTLSLGIAFIGGSSVVVLDEPTSGMDPWSRRFTWEIIRRFKEGRTILLTTHYMDEADILGDRIAIMADGELRCCGSSLFLKRHFGVGYNLTVVKVMGEGASDEEGVGSIEELIKRHVPDSKLLSVAGSEVSFQLPNSASGLQLEAVLTDMDREKKRLGIDGYGMSITTLEEVFIRVARGTENLQLRQEAKERRRGLEMRSSERDVSREGLLAMEGGQHPPVKRHRLGGDLFRNHLEVLLKKRWRLFMRDKKIVMYTLFAPPLFLIFIMAIMTARGTDDKKLSIPTAIFLAIGLSYVPAAWTASIVKEREVRSRHQQVVCGISLKAYWASAYIWDLSTYWPMALVLVLILGISQSPLMVDNIHCAVATCLLFFLYGPANASMTYTLSFGFNTTSNAIAAIQSFNVLTSMLFGVVVLVLEFIDATKPFAKAVRWPLRVFPGFCLIDGILTLGTIAPATDDDDNADVFPSYGLAIDAAGADIIFLVLGIFVYGYTLVVTERLMGEVGLDGYLAARALDRRLKEEGAAASQLKLQWDSDLGEVRYGGIQITEDDDVLTEKGRVMAGASRDESGIRAVGGDTVVTECLRKAYPTDMGGQKIAVRGIDIGVKHGECFGLLGVNGAGKTSFLAMLCGEESITEGDAFINGLSTKSHPDAIQTHVGYCPQFDALFDVLTVREHIEFYATIKGIPPNKLDEAVTASIEEMDLVKHAEKLSMNLSGGNKRKLSVAISLLGTPDILLLDEPSAGIDPVARRFMWDVLSNVIHEKNKACSIILCTHSMEECEALCPRMAIMVSGRLRCLGSAQHLKMKFGSGYQLKVTAAVPTSDVEKAVAKRVTEALTLHFESVGTPVTSAITRVDMQMLEIAVREVEPLLLPELTRHGQGAMLLLEVLNRGSASLEDVVGWICQEKTCLGMIEFITENFEHGELLEKVGAHMSFKLPLQSWMSLGTIFGVLERQKNALCISEYSLGQTSLEQVFNSFAAQQVEEGQFLAEEEGPAVPEKDSVRVQRSTSYRSVTQELKLEKVPSYSKGGTVGGDDEEEEEEEE